MIKKIIDFYARLSKREKWILWLTLGAILIVLGDRVVVGPVFRRMGQVNQQILDEETAIKKSLHVLRLENRVRVESKELAAYVVSSGNPEQEMTQLLKEIETLASQSSVSLVYVKPSAGGESPGEKKYFATLECEAQMEQIANFFYGLESSARLLKIEKYEIQPKNKESTVVRCVMTVSRPIL